MNNETPGDGLPGSVAPQTGNLVAGLSQREREVLVLVASGMTNRAISERLVISIGTADRHLHNILAKLGCATRTEAAGFAPLLAAPAGEPSLAWSPRSKEAAHNGNFVGRAPELARLETRLSEAKAGHGGLTMVVGEPGIGKTRLTEEFAGVARRAGFDVLWGRCYEGDWTPPYVPFAEALTTLVRNANLRELSSDLGFGGPPLARLVPAIRERLPDLPEPAALGPNEEQFRIFDAVLQLLLRRATRRPMLLVVDDLHWADAGTLTMLRYVSRLLKESRICLVGNYRDVELDRRHPLTESLADLRRDAGYEHIALQGLEGTEVGEMLESMAGHEVDGELVRSIRIETGGNPLFIREMLLHLKEEAKLVEDGGRWISAASTALAIPESVRQVIGRRLARLSEQAISMLSAASAFNSPFRFDVALEAADLDERSGLDAVDAATRAQLIRASGAPDTYEFTHALIAHTLYSELNPSRRVRLHRRIAEALQARPVPSAAEVAYQFSQSVALPGADAGAAWALRAADQAQASYAWEQVVAFLEMTLELMAADEERRAEVTGRLGLALAATPRAAEAVAAMKFWAESLFQRGADEEGLDYLMDGYQRLGVADGLEIARFAGPHLLGLDNRPTVWFRMVLIRAEREAGPDYTEAWLTPEREELFRAWDALPGPAPRTLQRIGMRVFKSRAEVLALPRTYSSWVIS